MNISRKELYRIIVEEYARGEGLSEDKVDDLLAHIKGGPKPDWMGDEDRPIPEPPEVPETDTSETYPMDIPDRAEMSHDELASSIGELVHGRAPEEVSEIFQMVFEKIPGVELSSPGDEDYPPPPPTEYGGEEYELRQKQMPIGFREQLINETLEKIYEMAGLSYGTHSMAGVPGNRDDDEWYDITAGETAPPHSTGAAEPQELIQKIEDAYHTLQDAFDELPDEIAQEMGRKIISDLETLMDTTEYPEDYRE